MQDILPQITEPKESGSAGGQASEQPVSGSGPPAVMEGSFAALSDPIERTMYMIAEERPRDLGGKVTTAFMFAQYQKVTSENEKLRADLELERAEERKTRESNASLSKDNAVLQERIQSLEESKKVSGILIFFGGLFFPAAIDQLKPGSYPFSAVLGLAAFAFIAVGFYYPRRRNSP